MRSNAVGRGRCARGLKKEGQARRCNCLLKIITAVFAVGFAVSIFFTISAFAAANLFKIQNAELSELSATAEGAIISFDESNIVSDVTFHKLNDSAKYTITLKNTDNKNRIIESVTDDSENPYISYEYEQYQGEQINAGANFVFVVTAKYTTATSDISQRAQVDNVKILIHFTDIEEAIPININPKTSDNLLFSVSLLIISAVGLMIIGATFIKKHKKADKFIAAGIIAVAAIAATTTVKAATIEINSFTVSNNFSLKDKLIVTYEDGAGNSHDIVVDFNESVTIGDQEKDGYIFAGWEDETGTSIDLTQPITDDITIKPVFTKNNYSVIFDKNQGDGSMANLPMFYDEPKQLTKNAFTRTGYAFTGWNTNAGGDGISYADEQEVSNLTKEKDGSVTLYAQWSPIHYTISFNGNGATDGAMNSISAEYDKEIQLPASSFARAGYAQNGWKNGAASIVDQATVRNLADSEGATVTLDAVWTANTNTRYTVIHKKMHINGEGYFEADRDNLTGTTGAEVTPDRKEYTGFTTPSAQTKKILGDNSTEFIYEYVRNKYHFEVTDRTYITNDSDADGDYYYESTVTITAEERPGYEFEWSDGSKSYARTITIGTEAISLTPNYTEVQEADYTITHEKQKLDGSFELAETETKKGAVGQEISPAPKQYDGFETPQKQTKIVTADGNMSINYQYNRKQFTVRFDGQGGTSPADRSRKYEETVGALPQTTRTNFEFAGWFTDTSFTTQVTGNETVLADTTYYAKWNIIETFPTVWSHPGECEFNNGANLAGETCEYTENTYIDTGIALYKDSETYGKDYEIYFEIEEYGTQVESQATMMNSKLEQSSQKYPGITVRRDNKASDKIEVTQTISSQKASQSMTDQTKYVRVLRIDGVIYYETDQIERTPLQDLNEIDEQYFPTTVWFGAASNSSNKPQRYFVGKLKNMYVKLGKYADTQTHYISFNANGGEGSMPKQAINSNETSIKIAKNSFHRSLYDFTGWNTQADGNGTSYTDEQLINGAYAKDMTLYAQWSRHFYTISYNLDGGTLENNNPTSYNEDSSAITLNNPSKIGYDFIGWTGSNGNEPQIEVIIAAGSEGDREYTANYNRKEYTITFNPNGGVLGTDEAERIVLGGDPLGELPTPTRDGYIFQGWYQGIWDGARVTSDTIPAENTTYYARWATAQSLYLTVKDDADNLRSANVYTGNVTDELGDTLETDIYYYNGETPSNNVIFGDYCWQIVRTTATGGVKIIYNGSPINGTCTEANADNRIIGISKYAASQNSLASGYMRTDKISMQRDPVTSTMKFGSGFTYNNGIYTLTDVVDTIDNDHKFTCANDKTNCDALRYYNSTNSYMYTEFKDVADMDEAAEALSENSLSTTTKDIVDSWYENNLMPYTDLIEDAIYCSNRKISNSSIMLNNTINFSYNSTNTDLSCEKSTDRLAVGNNSAKLTYPIGLITKPEALLGKTDEEIVDEEWDGVDKYYLNIDKKYWTMTPASSSNSGYSIMEYMVTHNGDVSTGSLNADGDYDVNILPGIRPVISLASGIQYDYGDGTKENPYYINTGKSIAHIDFEGNGSENTPSDRSVEKGQKIGKLPELIRRGYNLQGWYIDGDISMPVNKNTIINDDVKIIAIWTEQKFHSDSWETIIENARNSNIGDYNVGDYKEIEMSSYGTRFVRIANKSRDYSCSLITYSQTACGLVLEFDEVSYKVNSNNRNEVRDLNTGYLQKMPSVVKDAIIHTRVGRWDSSTSAPVFTKELIYEPSTTEVMGKNNDRRYFIDRMANATTQLDYYKNLGVNTVNAEPGAKKSPDGSIAMYNYRVTAENSYTTRPQGGWIGCPGSNCSGYAPLFRLGKEYTITYDANGGKVDPASELIEDGGVIANLPIPTRGGYDFVAWYSDAGLTNKIENNYAPTSNMTLYAKWNIRNFNSDSWDTIVQNVYDGTTDDYELGDVKEIETDLDGDGVMEQHKLRLINKSTPQECGQEGFSQTACGFVIEFYSTISSKPYSGSTRYNNYGSWPASEQRSYMNNDIFNALPEDLKPYILDTYAVSGHGSASNETSNFESEDRLYAHSNVELGETDNTTDSSTSSSRTQDYYINNPDWNRYNESSEYWLRSPVNTSTNYSNSYYATQSRLSMSPSYNTKPLVPVFRIQKIYTITYDTKGGEIAKPYKQVVTGDKIGTLLEPTRTGYDFSGWYKDEEYDTAVDTEEVLQSSTTFYAKWTPKQYVLHFDTLGGEEIADRTITYDQPIGALPTNVSKENHTFVGWFDRAGGTTEITGDKITDGNLTVYAKWTYEATVTFNANTGSFSDSSTEKQATYTIIDALERQYSYTPNIDNDGNASGPYSGDMSRTHTVTFDSGDSIDIDIWYGTENGSDWVAIYPKDVEPTQSNYSSATISGGKLTGSNTYSTTKPADNSSYHKQYHVDDTTVKFYFRSDRTVAYYGYYAIITGAGKAVSNISNYEEPTHATAEFAGWYTSPDCNDGEEFDEKTKVRENITLYAKWNHTIEFDANGGEVSTTSRKVKNGDTIGELPEPTRDGYIFIGWYNNVAGDGDFILADYVPTSSHKLYAKWGDKTFYNLAVRDTATNKALRLENPANDSIDENENDMGVYYYQTYNRYIAFGGFCWQYARTTTSGAIKIRYAGIYDGEKCTSSSFGNYAFNTAGYAGYMYNDDGIKTDIAPGGDLWKYAESFEYESGSYHLINMTTSYDTEHPYACSTVSGWCNEIRYYTSSNSYKTLNGQTSIDQIYTGEETTINAHDSSLKQTLENWYETNLLDYDQYVDKNTIYCNNRKLKENGRIDESDEYACKQTSDEFAVNNPEAPLRYGIGLLTRKEALMQMKGGSEGTSQGILGSGEQLTMTPTSTTQLAYSYISMSRYHLSSTSATAEKVIKPVIALVEGTKFSSGTGTFADPYVADADAENHYAIKFEDVLNDSKSITKIIRQGEAIDRLPEISEPGHTFVGWYADREYTTPIAAGIVPTANTVYYAKWEANTLYDEIALSYLNSDPSIRRYDGMATDSMINPSKLYNIYYYHGRDIDEHKVNNHVIIGDKCWRIVRTTNTGGLKIIYDGAARDGVCNNTGEDTWISSEKANFQNTDLGLAGSGYMYNKSYKYESVYISTDDAKAHVYGKSAEYYDGAYHLVDTVTDRDNDHRYSCADSATTCNPVRYYFEKNANYYEYYDLHDGLTKEAMIKNALYADDINQTESKMKQIVENWYENNMLSYSSLIEDTVYCNDRAIKSFNYGWSTTGMVYKTTIRLYSGYRYWADSGGTTKTHVDLRCTQPTDKFSVSNTKAPLKYPVGLITYDEMLMTKKDEENNIDIGSVQDWWLSDGGSSWTMTPGHILSRATVFNVDGRGHGGMSDTYSTNDDEKNGVRPVITLKNSTTITSGNGTSEHPYVIDLN